MTSKTLYNKTEHHESKTESNDETDIDIDSDIIADELSAINGLKWSSEKVFIEAFK